MGFKTKETLFWVIKEEWAGKGFLNSETRVPITEEDIKMIIDALFDSRYLLNTREIRSKLGDLISEKVDVDKLIAKHLKEREK